MTAPVRHHAGAVDYTSEPELVGRILARLAEAEPVTRRSRPNLAAGRLYRPAMFGLAVGLLMLVAFRVYASWMRPDYQGLLGWDLLHYVNAVERWLATGTPYLPSEVAGEFVYQDLTYLHPPITLLLFAPFLVLPWWLFWAIPLAITGYVLWSFRPAPWAWPVMVAPLVIFPPAGPLLVGNSDLWVWAAFSAGVKWGWPAAFLGLKPSIAFAAIVGVRKRSFWVTCLALGLASIPFGALWVEWFRVVTHSPGSLLYSAPNLVIFGIVGVAWATRRGSGSSRSTEGRSSRRDRRRGLRPSPDRP